MTVSDESSDLPVVRLANQFRSDVPSGRGLWIVAACSADWGTDLAPGRGKSVWALFAKAAVPV